MPARQFNKLWAAIDILESQEHIGHIKAIGFHNLAKGAKTKRNKELYAAAYPKHIYKKDAKDSKDFRYLARKLGGG